MFGIKKLETATRKTVKTEKQIANFSKLETRAKLLIPEMIKRQSKIYDIQMKYYLELCRSWELSCECYGNYLALKTLHPKRLVAVHIGDGQTIRHVEGSEPNMHGLDYFRIATFINGDQLLKLNDMWEPNAYVQYTSYQEEYLRHPVTQDTVSFNNIAQDHVYSRIVFGDGGNQYNAYKPITLFTTSYGLFKTGYTLHVPAFFGTSVYQQVLDALKTS